MRAKSWIPTSLICLLFGISTNVNANESCVAQLSSPLVVNVKDKGAKGNGIADDTAAIESAINQVAGTGGTVFVPDGIYLINAIPGVRLKSDMTLRMSQGTVLRALPNNATNYSILNITGTSNVNVIGGAVIGERDKHLGTSGEWGFGVLVRGASNVVIEGVTASNSWGDGFYVDGLSKNVKFCSITADNNRRQGLSIVSVDGMVVRNSIFKNTIGTAPQAGIDLEPNDKNVVKNVRIIASEISGNKGFGIQIVAPESSLIQNVTIDGNTIRSNSAGGIGVINTSGQRIINNLVEDNQNYGIRLFQKASGNIVTGNRLNGKNGVLDDGKNTVINNHAN